MGMRKIGQTKNKYLISMEETLGRKTEDGDARI
jgi:hypothetical protein